MRRSPIWMTRKSLWTERISGSFQNPTISGKVKMKFKKEKVSMKKNYYSDPVLCLYVLVLEKLNRM
jgi:hypothetical protein